MQDRGTVEIILIFKACCVYVPMNQSKIGHESATKYGEASWWLPWGCETQFRALLLFPLCREVLAIIKPAAKLIDKRHAKNRGILVIARVPVFQESPES